MRGDKRLLLVGAIAALVLLAVPAWALGAVWKDRGVNVTRFTELRLSGGEIWEETAGNGMNCRVEAVMTTEGGSTARITNWRITECPKAVGNYSRCGLRTAEAKSLPWTVNVGTNTLTISNMKIKRTFNGGCAEFERSITSTTVNLIEPTAITEMEWNGTNGNYKSVGSFTVNPSGTYGIG